MKSIVLGAKQRRYLVSTCGRPQGCVGTAGAKRADVAVYESLAAKGLLTLGDEVAYVTPYGRYACLPPHDQLLVRAVLGGGASAYSAEGRVCARRLVRDGHATLAGGRRTDPLRLSATDEGGAFVRGLGDVAIHDRVMVECAHCGGDGQEQAECSGCGASLTYQNQSVDDPEGCCKVCAGKDGSR